MKYYISDWIELLLKKIAIKNTIGPTFTSRWLFITTNCIYNSYQSIIPDKYPIDKNYWVWYNKPLLISNENMRLYWVDSCCYYIIPKIIKLATGFDLSPDELPKHPKYNFTNSPYNKHINKIYNYLDLYLSNRDNDGWKNTTTFNTNNSPNLENTSNITFISTDNSIHQNLNNLNNLYCWTPLQINSTIKNYLTPEWGTANSGIIDTTDIINNVLSFYPSNSQMIDEAKVVKQITDNLSDYQKMIAEFWAGGPGTVTPPGMWIVFADIYLRSNNKSFHDEIKFYTLLSHCVYQSGICAWKLKRTKLQSRPIQLIRAIYYNTDINDWTGESQNIKGENWLPYQEFDFVTPPFPDFVSGHSTFSSSCSKMLFYLTGTNTINLSNPICNIDIINYLSPVLSNTSLCLNQVLISPKKSNIINTCPKTVISLNWNSWCEMSISSGDSRIYGGIHIESSNKAGIFLGDKIADKIWNLYNKI